MRPVKAETYLDCVHGHAMHPETGKLYVMVAGPSDRVNTLWDSEPIVKLRLFDNDGDDVTEDIEVKLNDLLRSLFGPARRMGPYTGTWE